MALFMGSVIERVYRSTEHLAPCFQQAGYADVVPMGETDVPSLVAHAVRVEFGGALDACDCVEFAIRLPEGEDGEDIRIAAADFAVHAFSFQWDSQSVA